MTKQRKSRKRLTVSVTDTMVRKIEKLAREQKRSVSAVVEDTLRFLGVRPGELVRAPSRIDVGIRARDASPQQQPPRVPVRPLSGLENSTVPGRITVNLTGEMAELVNAIAIRDGSSKNRIVHAALEQSLGRAASARTNPIIIQNRDEIIGYSRILIDALQEALDYDAFRQHNRVPPALRLDESEYLSELRALVAELQKLNSLLEEAKVVSATTTATKLGKHFDKFFESYAGALGKGAAGLTIGVVAMLLAKAGVAQPLIDAVWDHLSAK